ncbi:MAG: transposase, partial [Deltaproteobacteria bacterium]|nr:transposase [Deltaproteobacteria bacterium]
MVLAACLEPELQVANSLGSYARHQPEKTLLYQTVQNHMAAFFAHCEASERSVPSFIKEEFDAFLHCGILAHGFARVYCKECRYDRLVAFSCKKRGFCGSCMARRMSSTAAHLVDSVIPVIPTRQWVLSVPSPLRYLMAYDSKALNKVINTYTSTIFGWLRKKAVQAGVTTEACAAQPGAITFVQRFGSALNLNVHLHGQFSDGVFVKDEAGQVLFHKTPAPTLKEIRVITEKVARRMHKWLQKRLQETGGEDALSQDQPLLATCYTASLRYLTALGAKAGRPLMRVFEGISISDGSREERTVAGFNLHASIAIAAEDRQGLERLLRYMGRSPLSEDRLSQ